MRDRSNDPLYYDLMCYTGASYVTVSDNAEVATIQQAFLYGRVAGCYR